MSCIPPGRCRRTFTACWTCRRRRVKCDGVIPHCTPCRRMRVDCEGYHVALVWVDSKTGAYRPQLRRAVDCESTWRGFPVLDHDQVNLMIEECDTDCGHQTRSADTPFNVFSLSDR